MGDFAAKLLKGSGLDLWKSGCEGVFGTIQERFFTKRTPSGAGAHYLDRKLERKLVSMVGSYSDKERRNQEPVRERRCAWLGSERARDGGAHQVTGGI